MQDYDCNALKPLNQP